MATGGAGTMNALDCCVQDVLHLNQLVDGMAVRLVPLVS